MADNPSSLKDYAEAVKTAMDANPEWRGGQAAFNVLAEMRPDLSERIRGSLLDPFYKNDEYEPFLEWLKENW